MFLGYRSKGKVDTFQHHATHGLSHHSETAPRPFLKNRIRSSFLGSMLVTAKCRDATYALTTSSERRCLVASSMRIQPLVQSRPCSLLTSDGSSVGGPHSRFSETARSFHGNRSSLDGRRRRTHILAPRPQMTHDPGSNDDVGPTTPPETSKKSKGVPSHAVARAVHKWLSTKCRLRLSAAVVVQEEQESPSNMHQLSLLSMESVSGQAISTPRWTADEAPCSCIIELWFERRAAVTAPQPLLDRLASRRTPRRVALATNLESRQRAAAARREEILAKKQAGAAALGSKAVEVAAERRRPSRRQRFWEWR